MSCVIVDNVGRKVELNAKCSEDVSVGDVVECKVVVSYVEALVLVTYTVTLLVYGLAESIYSRYLTHSGRLVM